MTGYRMDWPHEKVFVMPRTGTYRIVVEAANTDTPRTDVGPYSFVLTRRE